MSLLSGGNPQIAKADGDAPVQAYIAGMPGWKRGFGKRLDALIERSVPNVRKAVTWNSPLYGIAGQGWSWGSTRSPTTADHPDRLGGLPSELLNHHAPEYQDEAHEEERECQVRHRVLG